MIFFQILKSIRLTVKMIQWKQSNSWENRLIYSASKITGKEWDYLLSDNKESKVAVRMLVREFEKIRLPSCGGFNQFAIWPDSHSVSINYFNWFELSNEIFRPDQLMYCLTLRALSLQIWVGFLWSFPISPIADMWLTRMKRETRYVQILNRWMNQTLFIP